MNDQLRTSDNERVFDTFSPRKAILQTRQLVKYVGSRWKQVLLVAVLAGLSVTALYFFKEPLYEAEITFTLDEGAGQAGNSGGLADLGVQLGIGGPVNTGGVFSSMSNILELMQSRLLIRKTLLRTIHDGRAQPISFADYLLDSMKYREKWMKGSPYYGMKFLPVSKDEKKELYRNRILENMYSVITQKYIRIGPKGKGTTIVSVACVSTNEFFSKYFLEALLDEVSGYYVEIKTRRAKNNLLFIQRRTDSIRTVYHKALYGRASFTDANINPNLKIAVVSGEKQQTDLQVLSTSYIELVRSLESAKTALMRETPLIQLLDMPVLPLKRTAPGLISTFLVFSIAGAFLAIGYYVLRKIYKRLLAS